ncbi:MAG: IS4 family transposase [Betaproteobacteria bacterium]
MVVREILERMEQRAPVSVMLRAMLENVFAAERLDRLFEKTAQTQENKTLLFSAVADMMALVALKIQPSVHAAYQERKKDIGVTAKAIYDKLQRTEPCVSQAIVRDSAMQLGTITGKLRHGRKELLPGYYVKVVDGNHFRRTERRLKELRTLNAAPLPAHCLVVLDPQTKLAIDVFPCEDGHAQERTLLPAVLETVERDDAWMADRNFCTRDFLLGIQRRRARFIIRQHASLPCQLVGKRRKIGHSETGVVFEQALQLLDADGAPAATFRRITVELIQPTRDGEHELHIVTNLPRSVTALRVAELYRKRWTIETAFQEIAANLEGEIETLGYPRAALFAFCMALVSFNLLSVILSAFRATQQAEAADEISIYYLCDEIAHTYRGLDLVLNDSDWAKAFGSLTPAQLARRLEQIAAGVDLSRYRKHQRGPKKTPPKMHKTKRNHVSTARVLIQSRGKVSC